MIAVTKAITRIDLQSYLLGASLRSVGDNRHDIRPAVQRCINQGPAPASPPTPPRRAPTLAALPPIPPHVFLYAMRQSELAGFAGVCCAMLWDLSGMSAS